MDNLKPCPLCGGAAEIKRFTGFVYNEKTGKGEHSQSHGHIIICTKCALQFGEKVKDEYGEAWGFDDNAEHETINLWNTRHKEASNG